MYPWYMMAVAAQTMSLGVVTVHDEAQQCRDNFTRSLQTEL